MATLIVPYNVHFIFDTYNNYFNFDANVDSSGNVRFSNFKFKFGTLKDEYNVEVYSRDGRKKFELDLQPGDYVDYWGNLLFERFSEANLKVGDYFKITGMETTGVSLNRKPVKQDKVYVFSEKGIEEDNPVSILYNVNFDFLNLEESFLNFKASVSSIGNVVFYDLSYDKLHVFEDIYLVQVFSLDGSKELEITLNPGEYVKDWGVKLFDELNQARLRIGHYIRILGITKTSVEINNIPVDPKKIYVFDRDGITKADPGITPYTNKFCFDHMESDSLSFNSSVDILGNVKFYDFEYSGTTFQDEYNIVVYSSSGSISLNLTLGKGQYIDYWGKLLFDDLNKCNLKVGDYFKIKGMKEGNAVIDGKPINPKMIYVFGENGIEEKDPLGVSYKVNFEISSKDKLYMKFNAYVNNTSSVVFKDFEYGSDIFKDFYNIKFYSKDRLEKFSMLLLYGEDIPIVGKELIDELNKAKILLGDCFRITGMIFTDVKINGKPINKTKKYVFGENGIEEKDWNLKNNTF